MAFIDGGWLSEAAMNGAIIVMWRGMVLGQVLGCRRGLDEIVASWHPPKTLNFQIPASNLCKHKNRLPHNNYLMYWSGQLSPIGQIKGGLQLAESAEGCV